MVKRCIWEKDWVLRKKTIEWVAFVKMFIPIFMIVLITNFSVNTKLLYVGSFVIIYDLLDTTTYLVALMFLADIQRPSANVIRSLLMLVVNYIEVELDIIVIYLIIGKVFYDKIYKIENLFDFITGKIENTLVMNNIIEFVNIGIKFFF